MASSLHVEIVSAEKEIFSGEAKLVSASAQMGEVGIAPGHTPFISALSRVKFVSTPLMTAKSSISMSLVGYSRSSPTL